MLSRKPALVLASLLLLAAPALMLRVDSSGGDPTPAPGPVAEAGQRLGARPVAFVPNLGQWRHAARYVARFGAMTVFLEDDGWTLTLDERAGENESTRGIAMRMTFAGASTRELAPRERLPGVHHYFLGNDPTRWHSDVPLYGAVRYRGIRPNIDVVARGQDSHFEYDLVLAPGATLDEVEMSVEGIERMQVDGDGTLVLETVLGPVRMPAPPTWEEGPSGERRPIACRYVLLGKHRFGFAAPRRRPGWALVVDPGLLWSTFLGGSSSETASAIAVDPYGVVTVAGNTRSQDFPTTLGALDTTHNGSNQATDAFVTRLSSDASKLVWSTFLGGRGEDGVAAIALDSRGFATVAGGTASDDFPTTSGAFDRTYNGSAWGAISDGYVARLSPNGKTLIWSTYLGGKEDDRAGSVVLDAQGTVTLGGGTHSANFPTTSGVFDTTFNGGGDGFVARLDPTKTGSAQLVWSTFFGGSGDEGNVSIVLEAQGAATVAGRTTSSDFPTTPGAFDTTKGGVTDGFVLRLSATGSRLSWSTFLGGSRYDYVHSVALDAQGVVTVAGNTRAADFPTTPGAFDTVHNGDYDQFVAGLDPTKTGSSQLVWSTFLGGAGVDWSNGRSLAVDAQGAVTVVGGTKSTDFPTTPGAFDRSPEVYEDAFIARLSPMGSSLLYSTLLGGPSAGERALAVALDAEGAVTVAGRTGSANFPTTVGAFDTTYNGGEAFVTRLDMLPTGVSAYGKSSPGCKGPLAISVTSMPSIGNAAFAITCGNAPSNATGWLGLGASRLKTPLLLLGAGIFIDPNGAWFLAVPASSNAIGASSLALPIPKDRNLVKLSLCAQFLWGGPISPSPCPPLGLSASNALSITIQP